MDKKETKMEQMNVTFNLSNNRECVVQIFKDNVEKNIPTFKNDINQLLTMLQDVIVIGDEHREEVQSNAISQASTYLANMGVPLAYYFHMNVDDYRLSTTLLMDAIITANTIVGLFETKKE